jgi:hypothetical protein
VISRGAHLKEKAFVETETLEKVWPKNDAGTAIIPAAEAGVVASPAGKVGDAASGVAVGTGVLVCAGRVGC